MISRFGRDFSNDWKPEPSLFPMIGKVSAPSAAVLRNSRRVVTGCSLMVQASNRFPALPALCELRGQCLAHFFLLRPARNIFVLLRVAGVVIEFAVHELALFVAPLHVAITVGTHRRALLAALGVFADGGRLPRQRGRVEQRREALAFEPVRQRQVRQLGERREDVHEFHQRLGGLAGGFHAGRGDDQRRVRRALVVVVLAAPPTVLAHVVAMIAPEHDDRVLAQPELVEFREHAADARIHIADRREIGVQALLAKLLGDDAIFRNRLAE